jgi:hypothetical protein
MANARITLYFIWLLQQLLFNLYCLCQLGIQIPLQYHCPNRAKGCLYLIEVLALDGVHPLLQLDTRNNCGFDDVIGRGVT